MATEHEIQPYEEFRIPGTPLTVYHQGDEKSWAHVQEDGAVKLLGPADWLVEAEQPSVERTINTDELLARIRAYGNARFAAGAATDPAAHREALIEAARACDLLIELVQGAKEH
jgi:hypothetical protein